MRAFSLVTLSPEAFDDFSAHHADGNFQQTSAAGRLRAGQGIEVEYLGVQENGKIVAGALLETHRSRLSTFSVVQARPLGLSAQEFVGQIAHTATQLVHRKRELAR